MSERTVFEENLKTIEKFGYEFLSEDLEGLFDTLLSEDKSTLEITVGLLAKYMKKANYYKKLINMTFGSKIGKWV